MAGKRGVLLSGMVLFALCSSAVRAEWTEDFNAAKKEAAESGRTILANFSGSDWCGWCIRLDKEVFSKPEFQSYAKDNLVLFLADFPRKKAQSDAVKKQNEELAARHKIEGFPTILLLDAEGKVLATTGYKPGGAEAYVKHLKEIQPRGTSKDAEPSPAAKPAE